MKVKNDIWKKRHEEENDSLLACEWEEEGRGKVDLDPRILSLSENIQYH